MATVLQQLWARAATATLPGAAGPVPVTIWGFATTARRPGRIPGAVLEATAGDTLRVTLHNALPDPASIIFPGQEVPPVPTLDGSGRLVALTAQADPGRRVTYTVRVRRPGTFRYESGSSPARQVQMGLAGVLIVRPAGFRRNNPATFTVYGPGTGSAYDREYVLALGEIDTRLHARAGAGQATNPLDFAPDWWTINGRAFPDTLAPDNRSSQPMGARVSAAAGQRVLLRCVNLGFQDHSLHFGGMPVRVVGVDARPLRTPALDATHGRLTLTLAAGQACDVIAVPPGPGQYVFYDRDLLHSTSESRFPGGMMTRADITA